LLKETLHKYISLCHLPFGQVSRKNLHFWIFEKFYRLRAHNCLWIDV
jgi:hypothetical protein